MSTEITGTDLTVICYALRETREKLLRGTQEYNMLRDTLEKLANLNSLVDYKLEEKS